MSDDLIPEISVDQTKIIWDDIWFYFGLINSGRKLSTVGLNGFANVLRLAESNQRERAVNAYVKLKLKERKKRRTKRKETLNVAR